MTLLLAPSLIFFVELLLSLFHFLFAAVEFFFLPVNIPPKVGVGALEPEYLLVLVADVLLGLPHQHLFLHLILLSVIEHRTLYDASRFYTDRYY